MAAGEWWGCSVSSVLENSSPSPRGLENGVFCDFYFTEGNCCTVANFTLDDWMQQLCKRHGSVGPRWLSVWTHRFHHWFEKRSRQYEQVGFFFFVCGLLTAIHAVQRSLSATDVLSGCRFCAFARCRFNSPGAACHLFSQDTAVLGLIIGAAQYCSWHRVSFCCILLNSKRATRSGSARGPQKPILPS